MKLDIVQLQNAGGAYTGKVEFRLELQPEDLENLERVVALLRNGATEIALPAYTAGQHDASHSILFRRVGK